MKHRWDQLRNCFWSIIFALSIVIALILVATKLSNKVEFADKSFEDYMCTTLNLPLNSSITSDDLDGVTTLTIYGNSVIKSYEDLRHFKNLKRLIINDMTQSEVDEVIGYCSNELSDLTVTNGIGDFALENDIMSKVTDSIALTMNGYVTINIVGEVDIPYKLFLTAQQIIYVNNLSYFRNLEILSLTTENGFDSPLNCEFLADVPITHISIENGELDRVESISRAKSLNSLILADNDLSDIEWAESLIGIDYLIITQDNVSLIDNVFEDSESND